MPERSMLFVRDHPLTQAATKNMLHTTRALHQPQALTRAWALACLLACASLSAKALTLGQFSIESGLGEPLRAAIEITQYKVEDLRKLKVQLAEPASFEQAGMAFHPALNGLQTRLEFRGDGKPYIALTGQTPVNEHFVDVIVEAQWPSGRLAMNYTLLVSPVGALKPRPEKAQGDATATPAIIAPVVSPEALAVTAAPVVDSAVRKAEDAITVHAGEADAGHRVLEAARLGATRIGHGVRVVDDPAWAEEARERGLHFEVCPSSNVHTGAITDGKEWGRESEVGYTVQSGVAKNLTVRLRNSSRQVQQQMGDMTQVIQETIEGQKVVKLYGGQAYEAGRFDVQANRVRRFMMKQAAAAATVTIAPRPAGTMTRSASRASASGKILSTSTLSLPLCTSSRSFSMSERIQPLEPRILSSKVQMKRMSSVGA